MHRQKLRLIFIAIFSCLYSIHGFSSKTPMREFRGVWIATVTNIDWPSSQGLSPEMQKKEIDALLDSYKALGMNAIILQIRPSSDAFYPSSYDPWSKYLSGVQGEAPNPFYDPLDYYIEACHQRGLEFHAWFNPYRVKQNNNDELAEDHVFNKHPEWGWEYNNRTYMDPGIPLVRNFLTDVVMDVVERYDIDAVHFDDYFYPYPAKGKPLPDSSTFQLYGGEFHPDQIDDWRRENVTIFIRDLNLKIKKEKPWVKFGISPFGVWRNDDQDPRGSATSAGITNYDDLYADVLLWINEGWVDYVVPQLYWHRGHPAVDFDILANWWAENSSGRDVYVGHGLYRLNDVNSRKAWKNPQEIPNQIRGTRQLAQINGSVWYSSQHFSKPLLGLKDSLVHDLYQHPALIPTMPWIDSIPPLSVTNLRVERVKGKGKQLLWDAPWADEGLNKPRFFVVYCWPKGADTEVLKSENIVAIESHLNYDLKKRFFLAKREKYIFKVAALDRLYNESELSEEIVIIQ